MRVVVKLFAAAREIAGRSEVIVEVAEGTSLANVRGALLLAVPKLESLIRHARWAVDSEFVNDNTTVTAESEVALIPPVSGG